MTYCLRLVNRFSEILSYPKGASSYDLATCKLEFLWLNGPWACMFDKPGWSSSGGCSNLGFVSRKKLARTADLRDGGTLTFRFKRAGRTIDGFLARHDGAWVAYENLCQHLPVRLDAGSGRFFDGDGRHFVCQAHNATYEPLTGLCIRGPCEGQHLKRLKIEVTEDDVWLVED